ncbi:MAG: SU10 major capsid protein, partial [bacterium]
NSRKALSTIATVNYNYTQIFRTPINITATARSSATWDGGDLAYMRYKKGIEHALDIERSFLFGERREDLTETYPRRSTGGIISSISTNRFNAMGSLTETTFNNFLAQVFRFGSQTKYLFCSGELITRLSSWAHGLIQYRPTDTVAGISITEYISPHGRVLLVPHRMLTGEVYGRYGIVVDL